MIDMRNESMELSVTDVENAEIDIARYVQQSIYGALQRRMSLDAEICDHITNRMKDSLMKNEMRGLSNLCPFFDSHGVLCMTGMLSKIQISYEHAIK